MKSIFWTFINAIVVIAASITGKSGESAAMLYKGGNLHTHTAKDINEKDISLSVYKGKVALIVNVASRCGYTKQYAGLEKLHKKYADRGLAVLGFPANNFGMQEPGSNEEIKEFCDTKFGVSFDMFAKISVKGKDIYPLYAFLVSGGGNKELAGDVAWNFEKFLINKHGDIVKRYRSNIAPDSEELISDIEAELAK